MQNQTITIEELIKKIKKVKYDQSKIIWEQFVKWLYFQFKSDHHVSFGNIGSYGYKIQQKSGQKIPILFFNNNYLKEISLRNLSQSFILKPLLKINAGAVAAGCPQQIDKETVDLFLSSIIEKIDKILRDLNQLQVTINLDILGKITKIKNQIQFDYYIPETAPNRIALKSGVASLRSIVQREGTKSQMGFNKTTLFFKKQTFLPKIQQNPSHRALQRPSSFRKISLSKEKQQKTNIIKQEQKQKDVNEQQKPQRKSLDRKKSGSLRVLAKPQKQQTLGWQMMGAGKDPLKKDHDYAKLASDPKQLMRTTFLFKKAEHPQNVPVIDVFARTLACPVATQRQNPMVAGRIGSNLSLKTQGFQISSDGIHNLIIKSDTLQKRIQIKQKDKYQMTDAQQYYLITKQVRTAQEQYRLKQRKANFEKYIKLFDMIDDKNICQFKQEVMRNILIGIDSRIENPPLIKNMINEVIEDYLTSLKKSIIDYILLDPTQQDRLAVYIKYKNTHSYGEPKNCIIPVLNSNSLLNRNRDTLESNLLKNSPYFLLIQKVWLQNYGHLQLIELPKPNDPYIHIDEFLDKQKIKLKTAKQLIINEWMPTLAKIYRDEISLLNRNQTKCEVFFESAATFLSIQIRQLIEKQMKVYSEYFKQYDLKILNPPDTVVFLQKTQNKYENCFLNVRISHRKDQIYFMDQMQDLQDKFLSVLDNLRSFSQRLPRPQNLITKTEKLFLPFIDVTDQFFTATRNKVRSIINRNLVNVSKSIQIFNQYRYILIESKVIEKWIIDRKHDRRQYSLTFQKYNQVYDDIMDKIPFFIRLNMVNIDSAQLKHYLLKCTQQIIRKLQKSVFDLVIAKKDQIQKQLQSMIATASSKIDDCKTLVKIQLEVDSYRRNGIRKLQEKNLDLVKWIGITLYNTCYVTNQQNLTLLKDTAFFLHRIYQKLDKEDALIFQQRKRLEGIAANDSKYFNTRVKQLMTQIEKLKQFGSRMLKDSALQLLKKCRQTTNSFILFAQNLNQRELLLGMNETVSTKIHEIDKILKPFEQLWQLVKTYQMCSQVWTKDSIFKLNSDDIELQAKSMYKTAVQLSSNAIILKTAPANIKIAEQLMQQISDFQKNIPVIAVFSNPGLKQRHFTQIQQLISYEGQPLSKKSNLYLNKVMSMGVREHIEQLEVISQNATKQYMIETTISKINTEWEGIKFQMKNYKQTDIKILTGSSIEQIQTLLDDHSLKMITMKGSLHAKTFEAQLVLIQDWLNYTNSMIDFSAKVQSTWMYLQPVMTSPDILKHLSVEGAKFRVVDETWRDITKFYADKLLIKEITANKKIVEKLKQSLNHLEIVMKGLNSYLESKRLSFPRFFFLSNQELLQILSQTKDPTKVQPHLKKCFQGIARLQFEDNKFITGMYSQQGQFVEFPSKINTALARGNVDEWLNEVQDRMIKSIIADITKCHDNYQRKTRKQCLLSSCAMSVLTVQMTNWTKNVEVSIQQQSLSKAVKTTNNQLVETVALIKDYSKIKKVDVITLQALIVLSVHNLDIVKNLQRLKIQHLYNFEWQSQLRYYYKQWDSGELKTLVKILNATCDFNHEYLGNTSRLVITPLTDRCYRTLCSAIYLNYGGAPEGPAGTGKTQTVKDLAKALANQCVVFNCSDGLDYKAMGKFFKGLAASGAWSCFDEFNRINLQVLSVVAQQILCIQTAKAKNQKVLIFQQAQLKLKKNANCFITMNPGYAGRSQLPDNLKALFRSVAMMIPDYAMIAQISLYSYGFSNARSLARKIVSTYKLCSQQLSSQQHYDYGMRAVKSVLIAAGNLKRKYKDVDESSLVLKAINDVNIAKFLNFDIPLFNGITSDLFKDVLPPKIDYDALTNKVIELFCEHNLTQSSYSLQKIVQIYDMILVRHGLMVVGYPFSGKTTALDILAQALKRCQQQMAEMEVQSCRINPKSISMKQLYGSFDQVSHEWFDGVLAVKFRAFASSTTPKRKWIILDGPVDAVWIQNMNTVLDDNKKLCLNSGQIIAMNKQMSLIFEPMDLLAASPATVSRCGMIYMQPASLGHQVLIQSWLKSNDWLSLDLIINLKDFFRLLPLIYKQIEKTMKTICYVDIFNLTQTLLRNLNFQLVPLKKIMQIEAGKQFVGNEKNTFGLVSSLFGYACVWSFGGCVDTNSRKLFDAAFKKTILSQIVLMNKKKKVGFPDKGTLYDYMLKIDQEKISYEWIKWIDLIQAPEKPKKFEPHNIIVTTADSIKYNRLIQNCLNGDLPILLCGPTGTGKTTLIKSLGEKIASNQCGFLSIVLSSKTTCKQVAQQVQSKLDKKGSRNIIGPKQKRMIIYADDLNMPAKQKYGAQPPIQYFRQLLDQKGIYDFKEKDKNFKKIIDVSYLYSMAALNNDITPRFLRHSSILSIASFDEESLGRIFMTILGFSFEGHSQHKHIGNILKNSIQLYNQCVQILKPTPTKSHYIFNLRDLSKLITGICRADKLKINSENIGRLWGHQARRVFVDRLLPEDKHTVETFIENIGKKWGKNMNISYFSDILSPNHQRCYEEISDLEKVSMTVSSALTNYNLVSDKPMDLVLFNYALQHILIILRILRQPKGHALLVGLGGSGRKSFTYLSSFIAQLSPFSLQITKNYGFAQFRQDIKKLFIEIGVKNKPMSFLFADTMIKDEQFLQDINNILNMGFVPNLFTPQQKIDICQNVRKDSLQQTGIELNLDQLFQYFIKKVSNNIKLVLCFSPIGDGFRTRMRMFPSLVNCTTIDWFTEWPKEGLLSVGHQFLKQVDLKNKEAYIQLLQFIHTSGKKWSQTFYEQKRRKFYVTPTSFIEFITSFKQILAKKRRQIKDLIYKYENGYAKIVETQSQVEKMKKSLQQMKPMLKKAADDTSIKMQMVKIQKQQADVIMVQISGEEKVVIQAVNEANAIKEDCEKQLAVAMPQLKAAQNALLVLDKNSLTELKSMMNPPIGVRLTLQGLCLLIDPNPKQKMKNDKTLKMQTDWWAASIRLLSNPKLLSQLVNFNKEALTQNVVNNLGKFLTDPANKEILSVANVAKSSLACQCIIQWVNGVYNFYFVNKKVKPKKESLKVAQEKVGKLNEKLQTKRAELDSANAKVQQLRYELQWAQKNKQKLQKQYSECEIALQRAQVIMSSLGSEKLRWYDFSQKYKQQEKSLDKKIFMAAAQIIYFGAFTQTFRARILQQWLPQFSMKKLQLSSNFSLAQVLGNPVQIRSWNINGLPYDNFSVENGLIIYNSRRWPLMIDPQGQANKWLKKQQATRKIKIIKPFQDNFIRNLQNCIQFGTPVLIQNLGEEINVALTPILLKQTYKKGATTYLKMGQNILIYSSDFFLYMTTKLTNPHYLPEVCTQTAIINFMITQEGLSEQLLALIVSKERPDLETQKQKLIIESAANKKTLKQIQDKILDILNNSSNILGDQTAINVLAASKSKSNQIKEKQLISQQTQKQIDNARSSYLEVAQEGSSLFFAVSALENLESMYQYSLTYFMDLYSAAIQNSKKSPILNQRLSQFRQFFRVSLYRNIGRSLFQKDRLIFSILMAIKLSKLPLYLIDYLITSNDSSKPKTSLEKPKADWVTDNMWKNIQRLSEIQAFQNLLIAFNSEQNLQVCSKIIKSENPFNEKLPPIFQSMQQIYKVLLYKVFRPEKMIENCTLFVRNTIGQQFVQSLPFDLQKIYPDSNSTTPILFILSPGSDPFIAVSNFAKNENVQFDSISLGQGQGPIAQRLINQNIQKGGWVILQNCHLATSWMPNLQKLIEEFQDDQKSINRNFRLWLTSYPTNDFPQSVLQKSLKITNEPAKGLKNNLTVSYLSDPINSEEYFEGSLCAKAFKKLIYSLAFFHAVIQQRKKYGPLGWNIPYQFNESDLRISCKQLKIYVDDARNEDLIPFNALNYLIAQCNYGGKVTDQNDRRLLNTLLKERFNKQVIKDENHNYGNSNEFILPNNLNQHSQFISYIQNLPTSSSPELVGLHPNADITKDFNESNALIESLMHCVSSGNSGKIGLSQQETVANIITGFLDEKIFPTLFNLPQILKKYPIIYQDSMNTVLNQQVGRYNRLLEQIKRTLAFLDKAIKGEEVMTQELQKMYKSLYQNKVPDLWLAKSYPSLKPLGSYFADLLQRVNFFKTWIVSGTPTQFWLSGFFFTQSFLTGILQNYSRRNKIPVDELSFDFIFKKEQVAKSADGAGIYGLFIEGADWDYDKEILKQSEPGIIFGKCPNFYIKPIKTEEMKLQKCYEAPLYKTVARRGVLSTTGHSTNFVMMVSMPIENQPQHWIKRGVALLTQIN